MKNLLLFLSLFLSQPLMAQVEVGKTYRISPFGKTQYSLFVRDASLDASAAIVLWSETNVPAQQWVVGKGATSGYTLCNGYSGLYMGFASINEGATLQTTLYPLNAKWLLEAVDEEKLIYRLRSSSGKYYLGVTDVGDGATPMFETDNMDTQKWQLTEVAEPVKAFNANVRREMIDRYIARFSQSKGEGFSTFSNGSWGESEQLEVVLDAYETTGQQKYLTLATEMYNWFHDRVGDNWTSGSFGNYDWFGYDFNDDVMWQIIAVARLAMLTGDDTYRTAAKYNFDLIYERAYMPGPGMMRWAESTGERTSSNSCIMGPTEVAACYLAMTGCGEEYYEKARDLYAKQRQYLFDASNGQVYDNRVFATGSVSQWASTYNQGTMLGAATMLYEHYGTAQYRTDAEKIAQYVLREMCDDHGVIRVCQVYDGDLSGFKGILMRYVRRFVAAFDHPDYNLWMQKNAYHAYNNRARSGVTASAWLTKSTMENANNAFSCSSAVSAAANSVFPDDVPSGLKMQEAEESPSSARKDSLHDLNGRPLSQPSRHQPYIKNGRVCLP